MNINKVKVSKSIHLKLDAATAALLPRPEKVNVSEWIREAIREKAAREREAAKETKK